MTEPTDAEWVANLFRSADNPETTPPAAETPSEADPPQDDDSTALVRNLFHTDPKDAA